MSVAIFINNGILNYPLSDKKTVETLRTDVMLKNKTCFCAIRSREYS